MIEPPLPMHPNPGLVQRYTEREAQLELTHPTGDPHAFDCNLVRNGEVCGLRRGLAGRPGNKVLMCASCDTPDPGNEPIEMQGAEA